MSFDLREALPAILPKAIAWAEAQSSSILEVGQPLNDIFLALARSVGVAHPEHVHFQLARSGVRLCVAEIPAAAEDGGIHRQLKSQKL